MLLIPSLSFHDKIFVRGLQEEWFTRLRRIPGAVASPPPELTGSKDPLLMKYYRGVGGATRDRIEHGFMVEPNQMKIEMDVMLKEHEDSIRVMYHSWGTKPIMEGNTCKGVFFESKEDRKAVLARVVIDATGDADLCRLSGAPTSSAIDDECRCSSTALVYRIGGFSKRAFNDWCSTHREEARIMSNAVAEIHGFRAGMIDGPTDDVSWMKNWQPKHDCSKIADQTDTEMKTRLAMRRVVEYYRIACPEIFRNAFLYDIAPQLGTRGSHRIVGEYVISSNDWAFPKEHDDCIAWHCTVDTLNDNAPIEIPYRSILPQKVENILAPGRHISADKIAIDNVNLIPQCVGTGQAAGVAAAVIAADNSSTHTVDIRKVQDILAAEQDVPLPRNAHTDPSYMECIVAHEYGLYTEAAKKAREGTITDVGDAEILNPQMIYPERSRSGSPIGLFGSGRQKKVQVQLPDETVVSGKLSMKVAEDLKPGGQGYAVVRSGKLIAWHYERPRHAFFRYQLLRVLNVIFPGTYWIIILLSD